MPTTSSSETSYIYKIVRERLDSVNTQDTIHVSNFSYYDSVTLIDDQKINTPLDNSTISQTDNYGLWFNAEYRYTIYGRNVITGEDVNSSATIVTSPYFPINFVQTLNQSYSLDSTT